MEPVELNTPDASVTIDPGQGADLPQTRNGRAVERRDRCTFGLRASQPRARASTSVGFLPVQPKFLGTLMASAVPRRRSATRTLT